MLACKSFFCIFAGGMDTRGYKRMKEDTRYKIQDTRGCERGAYEDEEWRLLIE